MDPVINSLTQSPFVKSLSHVPAKGGSFTHGMRDNVPPFSMQKVVVQSYNMPSKTSQTSTHKFKIPQYGTLNRAYFRIRTKNQNLNKAAFQVDEETDYTFTSSLYTHLADKPIAAESQYLHIQDRLRMPWIHRCQTRINPTQNRPFGGGGVPILHQATQLDPGESGGSVTIAQSPTGEYASSLLVQEPLNFQGKSSNAWNAINVMGDITLSAGSKILETVPAETIPSEVIKMPEQMRNFYIKGMVGFTDSDDVGTQLSKPVYEDAWDPSMSCRDSRGLWPTTKTYQLDAQALFAHNKVHARNQHASFIVPVTLSSLKMLGKNYQTRFAEQLELSVDMKPLERGFNLITEPSHIVDNVLNHEVELVLIYHNWHDSIEEQIRRSNYKMNIPAQVYGTNYFKEPGPFPATVNGGAVVIPLTCRNLASEIIIVGRALSVGRMVYDTMNKSKSDYTMDVDREFVCDIEFKSGSKTLWSGTNVELQGAESSDYDLSGGRIRGGDCGYGGALKTNIVATEHYPDGDYRGWKDGRISPNAVTQSGIDFSFSDNMAIMKFGMQTTDEFYSGGIALQTMATPTITITPSASRYVSNWADKAFEFNVYVKYANMIEIDSESGAIRTTLNV